jgi:hypothetical protein
MLLVSGWSRMVPQCGQKAGPVAVALEAKNSVDMSAPEQLQQWLPSVWRS